MSERKKYDLTDCPEPYPGVFYWKNEKFILVKDGEHYLIPKKRMDKLVAETCGHTDEIVRFFKPRKRKPRDPNAAPKPRKKKKVNTIEREGRTGTPTRISPEFIFRDDPYEYDELGFRRGLKKWAKTHKDYKHLDEEA